MCGGNNHYLSVTNSSKKIYLFNAVTALSLYFNIVSPLKNHYLLLPPSGSQSRKLSPMSIAMKSAFRSGVVGG